MRIKKEKRRFSLFLLPLLCLTLFVGAMATGVTYSSYAASSSGGDSATVAKFDVDIDIGTVTSVTNGERAEIPIIITNNSEVTVEYDVVVYLPAALPSNNETDKSVVCSINGVQGVASNDGRTITISDIGDHIAAGTEKTVTLIIGSEVAGASGISDLNYLTYEDVSIEVYVTQVD